jgi:transposase
MAEQVHKRLTDEQVKMILDRFVKKQLKAEQAMALLGLKRSQFFEWVKKYIEKGEGFSIEYTRKETTRRISKKIENSILKELKPEKELIEDPDMPIRFYNYSYIQDQLIKKYKHKVSLPTIIDRAKKTVITYQDPTRRCMIMR